MKFQMDREKDWHILVRPFCGFQSGCDCNFSESPCKDRFVILACDGLSDTLHCWWSCRHRVQLLGMSGFWNAWTAAEALEYTHSLVANEEGGKL